MITIITHDDREKFSNQLDQYFLKRSICDQQTWRSSTLNRSLYDEFDTGEAVYLIYSGKEGFDYAGLRLIPNTEPTLLKNCCLDNLPENSLVDDKLPNQAIWECDRLFTSLPKSLPVYTARLKLICDELLEALRLFGNTQGILYYITLFETDTHKFLCKNGWPIIPKIASVQIREENYTQGRIEVCKIEEQASKKKTFSSLSDNDCFSFESLKWRNLSV